MQNGTNDQVDKIVKILNDGRISSTDVIGTVPDLLVELMVHMNGPLFRHQLCDSCDFSLKLKVALTRCTYCLCDC